MKLTRLAAVAALTAACAFPVHADTIVPSEWEKKFTITFSGYSGSETLTDFPTLVRLPSPPTISTEQTFNFADGGRYKVKFEGVKRTTSVAEWFLADAFGTPEKLSRNARGLLEQAVSQKGTDDYGRLFPLTLLWIPDEAKMNAKPIDGLRCILV